MDNLSLNDESVIYEPETAGALGFGVRAGVLGLLHMEIIEERLEREIDLDLVTKEPSVIYKVIKTNGEEITVDNPSHLPQPTEIETIEEPIVKAEIYSPPEYVGSIMELCQDKRGTFVDLTYLDQSRVKYNLPFLLRDFFADFSVFLNPGTRGIVYLE